MVDAHKGKRAPTSAAEALKAAREHLIVALKVDEAIRGARIDASSLEKHFAMKGETDPLWIPLPHHDLTQRELELWSDNNAYIAFGILMLQADSALNSKFQSEPLDDNADPERKAMRSIVRLLRNAFAHDPMRPVWKINSGYRQEFTVARINLVVDARALNGQRVDASHHGGWVKFVMLADLVLSMLERHE